MTAAVPPADLDRCPAAANLEGQHIPCDSAAPHHGGAHGNREFHLIWRGDEVEAVRVRDRQIERVRTLHRPGEANGWGGGKLCAECGKPYLPCPTTGTLDRE